MISKRIIGPAHRQRGAVLIWVAVALIALIGFVGLALDMGYVVWVSGELQNAADAAALAGAQRVRQSESEARDAAMALAAANLAAADSVILDRNDLNLPEGELVIGRYERDEGTFSPTLDSPNAVRVLARRTADAHGEVPLVFGPIFGHDAASISRYAIGMVGGGTGAGIIALDPDDRKSLFVYGDSTLNVNGGDIQVNSSDSDAVWIQGDVTVEAPAIDVLGDANFVGNAYEFNGEVNTNSPPMPDPLATLEYPAVGEPMSPSGILDSGTYSPGYYPNGLDLQAGMNVTLEPGIYVLDNGFQTNGNATLTALGVMFFIRTGAVKILGTGDVNVTPPEDGLYEGISFFQARENTENATITGTGFMDEPGSYEGGALYFAGATVQVGGTGDIYINQLIANKIEIFGTGLKTIMYRGDVPAAGNRVFLIE